MIKAAAVIGANYGDEGKGLITDYLISSDSLADASDSLVVRFNGGAQAGHTVQLPNDTRHVFSHFGSGTFSGAQTFLSEFFITNPILFKKELLKLQEHAYSPKVTVHPQSIVTTPYDMFINQTYENFLENSRHGSCGVGINETVERNLNDQYRLTVSDFFHHKIARKKLLKIRDHWTNRRLHQLIHRELSLKEKKLILSEAIFEQFLEDIETFLNYCNISDYKFNDHTKIVFEGAQGLLLDQNHQNFPHVTRSNTGIQNVSSIALQNNISHIDIHYVTRCYLTRHGAGPLENEMTTCPCPDFTDKTNIPHKFQGILRFAPLDIKAMNSEINFDLQKLSKKITKKTTLAVTCLDQFNDKISVVAGVGNFIELQKDKFRAYIFNKTDFDDYIFSYGPTHQDCISHKE